MSQENVDLTRRAFQAFEDRDLDTLLAMLDEDVEALPILAAMEGGYRGHDGVRRWWAGLLGTFPDFRAELIDVLDFGDQTIAVLRMRGHGAGSDTPVDAPAWQVSRFRNGKCTGWRVYLSENEAFDAVAPDNAEDVEIIRAGFAQWSEMGFAVEAIPIDRYARDVEWDLSAYPLVDFPDQGQGRENLLRHFDEYFGGWRDYHCEVRDLVGAGQAVVAALHETARIGDSGVPVERDIFHVFRLRHGEIVKWQVFETRAEALEAARLSD